MNYVRRCLCVARSGALVGLTLLALTSGCAKVTPMGPAGTGGRTSGAGGNGGGFVGTGGRGVGGGGGAMGEGGACQQGSFKFDPKIPTVYLLVDRSGSMFSCLGTTSPDPCADQNNTSWTRLKEGVLQVVQPLQDQVRFAFVAFTGVNGQSCPMLSRVPPALNNYQAISDVYRALPFRLQSEKWETPARDTLRMIGADLQNEPGDKYILFVTDGEPDYCGDGNVLCPPDSVIAQLQKLKTSGIRTIVMGLQSGTTADLPPGILQAFANAGAGEPTVAPVRNGLDINAFYDQCYNAGMNNTTPNDATREWYLEFIATGKPLVRGQTIGAYEATAGPTRPFTPDASNQAMLITQLSQALSGVKSCLFDLKKNDGSPIKVDVRQIDRARVLIEATPVPYDAAGLNGWRTVNNDTQLELVGTACDNWRKPENDDIDFQFPCELIIEP